MAKSFEGALLDELLAGTVAHTERVHALVVVALARHKVDHLFDVPDRPICQQVDMGCLAVSRSLLVKDAGERLVDLSATEISLESVDSCDGVLQGLIVVVDTPLAEHELVS